MRVRLPPAPPESSGRGRIICSWRLSPESNRGKRICNPVHSHSATQPIGTTDHPVRSHRRQWPTMSDGMSGAGNRVRTGDLNLGKVALYQLSYSRTEAGILGGGGLAVKHSRTDQRPGSVRCRYGINRARHANPLTCQFDKAPMNSRIASATSSVRVWWKACPAPLNSDDCTVGSTLRRRSS